MPFEEIIVRCFREGKGGIWRASHGRREVRYADGNERHGWELGQKQHVEHRVGIAYHDIVK